MKILILDGSSIAGEFGRVVCALDGEYLRVSVETPESKEVWYWRVKCRCKASSEHAAAAVAGLAAEASVLPGVYLAIGDKGRRYEVVQPVVDGAGIGHKVLKDYRVEV